MPLDVQQGPNRHPLAARQSEQRAARLGHPLVEAAVASVQVRYIVDDVDAAIAFYTGHLGFDLVMHPAPPFAMLSRGELRLVLSAPNSAGGGGKAMPDGTQPVPGDGIVLPSRSMTSRRPSPAFRPRACISATTSLPASAASRCCSTIRRAIQSSSSSRSCRRLGCTSVRDFLAAAKVWPRWNGHVRRNHQRIATDPRS
jgi:hypothetical protein